MSELWFTGNISHLKASEVQKHLARCRPPDSAPTLPERPEIAWAGQRGWDPGYPGPSLVHSLYSTQKTFTPPETRLMGLEHRQESVTLTWRQHDCGGQEGREGQKTMSVNFCRSTRPQEFLSSFMEPLIGDCEQTESMLHSCWLV